jgi:hypothetical protein
LASLASFFACNPFERAELLLDEVLERLVKPENFDTISFTIFPEDLDEAALASDAGGEISGTLAVAFSTFIGNLSVCSNLSAGVISSSLTRACLPFEEEL